MTALLLSLWLALDIQGTSTCPTPDEVGQHLTRLVPEGERIAQKPRAYLSAGEGYVNIELLGPEGGLLAERRLDQSGSCGEMAEAVAVVLAAWQAKFNPTVAPSPIEPPVPAVADAPAVVTASPTVLFDTGIGLLTSIADKESTFGAKLEAVMTPFAGGLGFHGAASLSTSHNQSTDSAGIKAQWFRPALALGPNLRLRGGSLALDIHGDAVLALLRIKGTGLRENASDTTIQYGVAAGLRGLWTWQNGAGWLGVDLLGFPGQDTLNVGNLGQVGHLPHVEIQIALGIALGRFR